MRMRHLVVDRTVNDLASDDDRGREKNGKGREEGGARASVRRAQSPAMLSKAAVNERRDEVCACMDHHNAMTADFLSIFRDSLD